MKITRFIFPFLFVRNWHDGSWEFSRARCILFLASAFLVILGVGIAYLLQAPIEYTQQ